MREIRKSGSEGGAGQTNVPFLPLSGEQFSPCEAFAKTGYLKGNLHDSAVKGVSPAFYCFLIETGFQSAFPLIFLRIRCPGNESLWYYSRVQRE